MSLSEDTTGAAADVRAAIENPRDANKGQGITDSSADPSTKRRQRPLWQLLFIASLPLLLLPVLSKMVWRLEAPVGKPEPQEVLPKEERIADKPREKPKPLPEKKEEVLPPKSIEEKVYGPEDFLPPEPFNFKDNPKVLDLLGWVANSKYVEGKGKGWRSLLREAFESGAVIPDIQGLVTAQEDRKEVVFTHEGKHIRLSCALFEIQLGWDGLQVARDLAKALLPLLEETLSPDYMANLPVRQHTVRVGSEANGVALATLSVGRMKKTSRHSVPPEVFERQLKEGASHE